jgi:hypothetical protein
MDTRGKGAVESTTTQEYTLTFSESSPGIQAPQRFAHKKKVELMANLNNHWEPVAMKAVLNYEFNRAEIKAAP